jgi:hypothetical protein
VCLRVNLSTCHTVAPSQINENNEHTGGVTLDGLFTILSIAGSIVQV